MRRTKSLDEQVAHVMANTDRNGRCWLWQRAHNGMGYGRMTIAGERRYVHRLVYEWTFGPIPDGLEILHACDTPQCVNPAHLRVGTHLDNMRDMHAKGRRVYERRTHCKHGHAFTPENTRWHGTGNYQRCRECENAPRRKANKRVA